VETLKLFHCTGFNMTNMRVKGSWDERENGNSLYLLCVAVENSVVSPVLLVHNKDDSEMLYQVQIPC